MAKGIRRQVKQTAAGATATQPTKVAQGETRGPALTQPLKPATAPEVKQFTAPVQARVSTGAKVRFVLAEPVANRVSLSGEFNGWSPEATPMAKDEAGQWRATLDLAPGRYEYKFVVDGQWLPDPNAREQAYNEFGTLNSVIEVTA